MKLLLTSSTGGHFEQLSTLSKELDSRFVKIALVEKSPYIVNSDNPFHKTYYLRQLNRKSIYFPVFLSINFFKTCYVFIKENPKVVISTGSASTLFPLFLALLTRKKTIFLETLAKVNTQTLSGKIASRFCDRYYVQWPELHQSVKNSIYKGRLY